MTKPAADVAAWLDRAGRQAEAGDAAGAAKIAAEGLTLHPDAAPLWNLYGAMLLVGGRVDEGVAALERAAALDASDPEPLRNLLGVQVARRAWERARAVGERLLGLAPRDAEAHRLLGAVAAGTGADAMAAARLRTAVSLDPGHVQAWSDLVLALDRLQRPLEACVAAADAVAANPRAPGLAMLQVDLAMRRLAEGQRHGWLPGRTEGLELQAAHDALLAALDAGLSPMALPWAAAPVFMRLMAREAMERLGGFKELGRRWAAAGDARNMLMQLPRARAVREDRLELLAQHRLWGEGAEAAARQVPAPVAARPSGGKIRLGFKSSDLRSHAIGTFAWPLFEHLDRERFEVYVYSFFPGPPDALQQAIAERVTAYRHAPEADACAAAAVIAADGLDVLFELGGPTGWNRAEVMAWRLAPIQASWLGYPHSLGLSTIDYMLLDRLVAPPDPALLMETPLLLPRTWIAMGEAFFRPDPYPAAEPPQARNGFVTFGTANASYKYSPACLDAWARVLAAAPGSRFLFVRPEADAPSFQSGVLAAFAAHGVGAGRIRFEAVRGAHLPFYDQMDVSLDTLPVTGGTTTCESLWMGVPVVSLVGEALYERLSYSILTHAGLGDLAVDSLDAYVATAVRLAGDVDRLRALRGGLRDRIRAGPLGDSEGFARDFYDLVAATVAAHRAR
ncbi:MAG TPA: hypothetical protein VL358_16310 [Caulobacteraceae bacterium]|jgi:predicted O-linked N-acetylglucosamine transferase (SPINDLY family)|nr:hypothetical protein [Caulobacteraceae bacterium]